MVQWRSLSPVLYNTWNFHRCLCALSRRNEDTLGFCGKVKHWQVSCMHTSAVAASSYAKNTKKKLVRPIRYKTKPMNKDMKAIPVWKNMTVAQLAAKMEKDVDHVFEVLMFVKNGERYEMEDSVLDDEAVIQDIVRKSGFKIVYAKTTSEKVKENKDTVKQSLPDPSKLVKRPPVVTIMGHVDHGKTTLLDALRHSSIVAGEFGGITQHIGAFSVKLPSGEQITFLDTPGHAAFTAMRARGAQLTDIIVLVVAAEDSVMEQTVESIRHAQNAKVPLIVAINKIDKPEADIERTERDLMANNVAVEALGGDVPAVPISALKETNLLELQETITALAEVLELKGDQQGLVEGRVVEARTDLGRGKLATVIVQRGTLKKGCYIVAGTAWAKVRSMFNDMGKPVQEAVPSSPVEIIGWKELPSAGDEIFQVESEQRVKEVVAWRKQQQQEQKMNTEQKIIEKKRQVERMVYEEELEKKRAAGRIKRKPTGPKQKEIVNTYEGPQLSLVLKGDVDGSVEAILDSLESYKSSKCRLDLLHYGVGNVTETDVELAEAFGGVVIGFNVRVPDNVSNLAKKKQVPIRTHKVIYTLFDDIKESLTAKLPVTYQKEIVGEANVIQVFEISDRNKKIPVAGCRCTKGMLSKKEQFQVMRRDLVVFDGSLSSLKHLKNEVETIKTDVECGLSIVDKTVKFECGDIITCYRLKEVQQTIDWELGF